MAPSPGRGLQEIACGARQAEVLLESGQELEGLRRSRRPAVLGQAPPLRAPSAPLESGPLEQLFQLFRSESDFLAAGWPGSVSRSAGGPEGAGGKVLGPSEIFFFSFGAMGRTNRGTQAGIEA